MCDGLAKLGTTQSELHVRILIPPDDVVEDLMVDMIYRYHTNVDCSLSSSSFFCLWKKRKKNSSSLISMYATILLCFLFWTSGSNEYLCERIMCYALCYCSKVIDKLYYDLWERFHFILPWCNNLCIYIMYVCYY